MPRETNIQIRRGSASDWASVNPTLASGEMAIENDTRKVKVGDGTTVWNELRYLGFDGGDIDGPAPTATPVPPTPTPTPATDPYFANVSLLMHFAGAGGSTTFTDSSGTPKTLTRYGNPVISSVLNPFGGTSGYFGGGTAFTSSGDYLQAANSLDFQLQSSDFTVEFWAKTSSADNGEIVGNTNAAAIFALYEGARAFTNAASASLSAYFAYADNNWHFFAFSKVGVKLGIWIDGNLINSDENRPSDASLATQLPGPMNFGGVPGRFFYNGYLSELRITRGVGRYDTSNSTITVPTTPFPDQ